MPDKEILREFEKYYEFITYSYKDIAAKFDINLEAILDFMQNNGIKLTGFDDWLDHYPETVMRIHELLRVGGISTREHTTVEEVIRCRDRSGVITPRNVLDAIFDDNDLKEKEVEGLAFLLVLQSGLTETDSKGVSVFVPDWTDVVNRAEGSEYGDVLRNWGIDPDIDVWEMEETMTGQLARNGSRLWGIFLELVIYAWVKREMTEIGELLEEKGVPSREWRDILKTATGVIKRSVARLEACGLSAGAIDQFFGH